MNKNQNLVKEVCEELGINQTELSRRLEVSQPTISAWNGGSMPKMAKIALELLIETKQQREQLKKIKDFYNVIQNLNIKPLKI